MKIHYNSIANVLGEIQKRDDVTLSDRASGILDRQLKQQKAPEAAQKLLTLLLTKYDLGLKKFIQSK